MILVSSFIILRFTSVLFFQSDYFSCRQFNYYLRKYPFRSCLVAHLCSPSFQEPEVGRLQILRQLM